MGDGVGGAGQAVVALTGAGGFIGTALLRWRRGSRNHPTAPTAGWRPADGFERGLADTRGGRPAALKGVS